MVNFDGRASGVVVSGRRGVARGGMTVRGVKTRERVSQRKFRITPCMWFRDCHALFAGTAKRCGTRKIKSARRRVALRSRRRTATPTTKAPSFPTKTSGPREPRKAGRYEGNVNCKEAGPAIGIGGQALRRQRRTATSTTKAPSFPTKTSGPREPRKAGRYESNVNCKEAGPAIRIGGQAATKPTSTAKTPDSRHLLCADYGATEVVA